MDLRVLRYFIVAVEAKSINEASRQLYVTQPTLTRQFHELEEEVAPPHAVEDLEVGRVDGEQGIDEAVDLENPDGRQPLLAEEHEQDGMRREREERHRGEDEEGARLEAPAGEALHHGDVVLDAGGGGEHDRLDGAVEEEAERVGVLLALGDVAQVRLVELLADDEVEYENVPGKLYDVQYPYADGSGYITVATTRPETMFGDVAVAVNPDDERYKSVVGKELLLPLTDRRIPIITDRFVDMEFGTGMVKITPAHDPNDWECGKRHNLEAINLLNPDGTLNENVPEKYRGMKAEEARALVVDDLKEGGYLVKITDHAHDVGHCYRCHTTVEPYLSEQWFVSMKTLADKALKAWKDGDIVFYPRRWENTYQHWMENIRDWCISRQLWWGHRIPVWYCQDCGKMIVSRTDPDECPDCHSHGAGEPARKHGRYALRREALRRAAGAPGQAERLHRGNVQRPGAGQRFQLHRSRRGKVR